MLPACREHKDPAGENAASPAPTATPNSRRPTSATAGVTPVPTLPGSTPAPSATPASDGSDDPTNPAGSPAAGAAMNAAVEQVTVYHVIVGGPVYVERANGEVWSFTLPGALGAEIGDVVAYESASLVFGGKPSRIVHPYPGGTNYALQSAARIR